MGKTRDKSKPLLSEKAKSVSRAWPKRATSSSVRLFKNKKPIVKQKAIAATKRAGKISRRGAQLAHKHTKRVVIATAVHARKGAKVAHHHVAVRPHQHLQTRWAWYERWHNWEKHHQVHYGLIAVYIVVVSFLVFRVYQKAYALSDIFDTWNFSNAAPFTLSDGVETSGSSARLKAQNYNSDANTAGLLHFDESSGSSAADSSANSNTGTVNGASFVGGNLNNGVTLDGLNDYVSVADSPSLSLSQQNTVEAWTKLDTTISPGATAYRQAIVDKGDYQLYYDNENGKLTYELASNATPSWTEAAGNDVNGSWDLNGKRATTASVRIGSNLYAATGIDTADAEVWMWNGTTWTQVGGDGKNGSWQDQTFEYVYALETDGTNIYAGLGSGTGDAEVWMWNGATWSKIGGDAVNSSWAVNTYELVSALDYFGGNLYAGVGSGANDAEVWRWNGATWTKIGGDSINSGWTTNFEMVSAMTNDGTNLYAGLGITADDAEVWRWNGATWTKIGGDSINSGWTTGIEAVRSLYWNGTTLYAGTGDTAGDADVWSWNGAAWTKIGGDAVNSSWPASTYEGVHAFSFDGTNLYAGLGSGDGDGEVWRWNGAAWTKIGGDGVNGSWAAAIGDVVYTLTSDGTTIYAGTYDAAGSGYVYSWNGSTWTAIGGQSINNSWTYYGMGSVETLYSAGDYMYAGTGSVAGSAQVWRYDGASWSLIGGQGVNGSWAANTFELITSMNSYNGEIVVGLGNTANDAEVWSWNGSTWTKIGGDSINSGWTTNYEEVNSMASYGGFLYAGLGNSANDAEVWRWNGSTWTKIGGDSINSGWTTNYERVSSMTIYDGQLHAGLGLTAGDAEVWRWNGSTWTKIGGDSINSGWDATIEQVESMVSFNNKLYAGLGNTSGDAALWEWNGSTWTKIGGDDVNSSWTGGTYENVRSLTTYNGDLIAGIGNSTADAEVWRYSAGSWAKIGGNSINGGWGNTLEEVEALTNFKGKLYAGTGNTANADAYVWSWGNNGYLQSTTSTFDTSWRHVAATYDGSTMKLYVNGVLDSSVPFSVSLPDSSRPLLIGTGYGGREQGRSQSYFDGQLDEVRISNVARTSFTTKPYSTTPQTVSLASAVRETGVMSFDNFTTDETTNGGSLTYRLSADEGATWQHWNGSAWVVSNDVALASSAATVDANIDEFPTTFGGITWQAIMTSDGSQRVALNEVEIASTSDSVAPDTNASNIVALKASGGASLAEDAWTNGSSPYFSWTAGTDADSGVKGYCLYLGTDDTADPVTTKGLLGTSPTATGNHCQFLIAGTSIDLATAGYLGTALTTSNDPYYLTVKTIDNAGNVSTSSEQFFFKFDNTPPTNPGFVTAPSGFINTKTATLTWPTVGGPAASDANAGLAGLQYKIGSSSWYGDSHTGAGDMGDLLANDGSYTTINTPDFANIAEGVNTISFRTWDQAGNVTSSYTTAALKVNTSAAPSAPQGLAASPSTNTVNSFSFSWFAPSTFIGDDNNLTYCYTFNVLPSASTCTFTSGGVQSLGAAAYATQPGINTIYLVAKDESGSINYSNYAEADFTTNTPSPGLPLNVDIVDVSIKSTSNWRLALTWDVPSFTGAGISSYKVYRSTNNVTFSFVGSSSSTTYIDAGLTQQEYFYHVQACDSTNNCGASSDNVSQIPTGKFTNAANLVAEPTVSNITTKKAKIMWSTDRASDSKIAIGTASGQYSPSEVGNSDQVSAHSIELDNLSAGTTYYYVVKWTDEDGNTGTSQEHTFTTSPAPTLKEISAVRIGLNSATIQFTSQEATSVGIQFGKTENFGGLKNINTSLSESVYNVELEGIDDGSKYFYRLISYDREGNSYQSSIASFVTAPRPRISNIRFQPVAGEPTSTQKITWDTNVPASTLITYGKVGAGTTDAQLSEQVTAHEITIRGLEDDSEYSLIAQSRDKDGNLAVSDRQTFRTALDTRPPKISFITVEPTIRGVGAEARGQVVVSWKTDEPSTSQVAFADGAGATVFNSKTAEDSGLSTEHVVIVTDLPTSRVYSLQPISRDKSGNSGTGEIQSAIIGRASDSVLTIILNTLKGVFGF